MLAVVVMFSCTASLAEDGGSWGFIDFNGNVVIPYDWDYVHFFSDGLSLVFTGTLTESGKPDVGQYGYIDRQGNTVIELHLWEKANKFSEDRAAVMQDGKYGFIDKTGTMVIEPRWDNVKNFSGGVASVLIGTGGEYSFHQIGFRIKKGTAIVRTVNG